MIANRGRERSASAKLFESRAWKSEKRKAKTHTQLQIWIRQSGH